MPCVVDRAPDPDHVSEILGTAELLADDTDGCDCRGHRYFLLLNQWPLPARANDVPIGILDGLPLLRADQDGELDIGLRTHRSEERIPSIAFVPALLRDVRDQRRQPLRIRA